MPHGDRELLPVAVLQLVDELTCGAVVARHGAGAPKAGRIGDRGRRQQGPPMSTAKGVPSLSQKGRAMKGMARQQSGQRVAGSAVMARQATHCGG